MKGWTLFWLIISSILSICAIAFCCACLPRVVSDINPHYDYLGIVIGILALFITFLVAWQIWATIHSDKRIEELKAYIDVEIQKERHTREYGVVFQAAIEAKDDGRYKDALQAFCAIVNATDIDAFIPASATQIHAIISNHAQKLGDKDSLKEDLTNAAAKFDQMGTLCKSAAKAIRDYLRD